MTRLYDRKWKLKVDTIETSTLDLTFDVEKTLERHPNKGSITVHNFSAAHRRQLEQLNVYSRPGAAHPSHAQGRIRTELEIGYGTDTFLLFRGDLRTAISQGPTDWTTKIEGEDGGRAVIWSRVNRSYPPRTLCLDVLGDCADAMGIGRGNLTDFADATLEGGSNTFTMGTVLSGSAPDELNGICRSLGLNYSVQNGNLQLNRRGQAIQGTTIVLRSNSGLLESPTRQPDGTISVKALIQPGLYPGRQINLDSDSVRGFYRIYKAKYVGDTTGGDWTVTLECRELIPVE